MTTPRLSGREDQSRQALVLLMNVLGLTDQYVAKRSGFSQQQVNDRRNGRTRIRLEDRERLAEAIGVPDYVFDMERRDLLAWLAGDGFEQVKALFGCITGWEFAA